MAFPLSFVIPTLNEEAVIAPLLRDLRERFPRSQLIVVDGGSLDRTVPLALPLCDQLLLGAAGRAAQMNLGAKVATAPYVCFLHADSCPGIDEEALRQRLMEEPAWGFCRVRLSGVRWSLRVIEWFMNRRAQLTHVATGDQMLFVSSEVLRSTGGFDEIPLMEDVAYCKRLRNLCRPMILPEPVCTSSRRWEEAGILSTVLRMWLLRAAYVAGVAPATLWRHYYGR